MIRIMITRITMSYEHDHGMARLRRASRWRAVT
jgi:hypothetical protein